MSGHGKEVDNLSDILVGDPSEEQVPEQGSRVEQRGAERRPPIIGADQVHLRKYRIKTNQHVGSRRVAGETALSIDYSPNSRSHQWIVLFGGH